jgi:hypothetical protein
VVRQIGLAIGELARSLSSHARVADAIGGVTQQAKEIAFKAWQGMVGGPNASKIVRDLIGDLSRLAAQLSAIAERASREAIASEEAAAALALAAAEFAAIAEDSRLIDDPAALRARLRPLAGRLEAVPERLIAGKAIAQAFAESAKAAESLAAHGRQACAAGRPNAMLQSVYDSMTELAGQTAKLSTWITANAERGHQVAASMALQVQGLSRPAGDADTAGGKRELKAIVKRGAAMIW